MALKAFRVDLHIHTCLSPCGDSSMRPTALVQQARRQGLDGIGICDHNSAENVAAVRKAGERIGLPVLGGMEITSREEVHILGFFPCDATLKAMQDAVYARLPGKNDEAAFGSQVIADEHDREVGTCRRLLIGATQLSVGEIVCAIRKLGGIAVASHVDREAFSIIGQLGFIPKGIELDALELSAGCSVADRAKYAAYGYPLLASSDAHFLSDIGKSVSTVVVEELTCSELRKALRGEEGRKTSISA